MHLLINQNFKPGAVLLNHKLVLSASCAQLAVRLIYGAKGSLLPPPPAAWPDLSGYQPGRDQGHSENVGVQFMVICCAKKTNK